MFRIGFIILCCFSFIGRAQNDSIPDRLSWDKTKKNSKELNALLTNPLDLQAFKKLKPNHSNSGGANKKDYYYKPVQKGFYYFYFVFNGIDAMHGPRITTYQKGDDIGLFMDTAEVFIQISCDRKDKNLGKLDLVGLPIKDLIKKYGENYLKSGENWVFQYNNTILILNGSQDVIWFKVTRSNRSFKNFEEVNNAKQLLQYGGY